MKRSSDRLYLWPAVGSLFADRGKLLTFFDFPAEHWRQLRTTNVTESPFATVQLRRRVPEGAGCCTQQSVR